MKTCLPHSRSSTNRLWAALLVAATLPLVPASGQAVRPVSAADAQASGNSEKKIPVEAAASTDGDDSIQLTPFEVNESQNRGYQATSTMSGTRLNTKLDDLAASISVVTKQQLEDTASVDINDVFKYELSTEGTSQFTSFSVDRNVVTDGVSKDPNTANRIRGLTSANVARNGFNINLPIDTYDVDSLEISRGPNSTVFGLGNTGGGVNIIAGHANTTKDSTSFTTRGDSYDGYRGTFDVNRVLIKNKLAVRVDGMYQDVGYERKPSDDVTRRLEVSTTVRPFHNTTIYASFETYRNDNNRPNSLTPRDTVTDWIASGKPTWNPLTNTVHLANGTSIGPITTTAQETALLPFGIALSDSTFQGSPNAYYNPDGSLGLFMVSRLGNPATAATAGFGPTNVGGTTRLMYDSNYYIRNATANPLFNAPEISNQSLYDWTSVNLQAPNFSSTRGETSQFEIDQTIFTTTHQSLSAQAAYLYERISTRDRRFLGTGGAQLEPYIDINETLVDGTPNPYFLRPYVGGASPSTTLGRNNTESYRGTIDYNLNFTQDKSFLRWLGHSRFTGFTEYHTNQGGSIGYQDVASSNNIWMGTVTNRNSGAYKIYPRYYVGDANGQNVDYAPGTAPNPTYTLPLKYQNVTTGQFITEPTTYDLYYDANRPNKQMLSTVGGVWQGWFLNDRIVGLLGARQDYSRSRDANSAINPTAATNGFFDMSPIYQYGTNDWVKNKGNTDSQGIVVKPFHWLELTYNHANSFSPGSAIYDVFGHPLPDPKGNSKDYGFVFHFFDDKLVITAKQFETVDIGRSTSDLNTIVQRAIRMDRLSSSSDPGLTDWYISRLQVLNPNESQTDLVAQTLLATGADYDYLRSHINKTHGDASNSYSSGREVEIEYNPDRYWRMKFTASQETPLNGTLSPAVQNYINSRMPVWTTIKDPVTGAPWWTTAEATNGTVPQAFYVANVLAPLKLAVALQGKRRTQTREYHFSFLTNYALAGLTDNHWIKPLEVGGSFRWQSKGSIGFFEGAPDSDGIIRSYDPNAPIWANPQAVMDLFAKYRMRFFHDRVQATLQLNVNNITENGHLQAVAVNPDGTPWAFRIVDPREFILSAKFDL